MLNLESLIICCIFQVSLILSVQKKSSFYCEKFNAFIHELCQTLTNQQQQVFPQTTTQLSQMVDFQTERWQLQHSRHLERQTNWNHVQPNISWNQTERTSRRAPNRLKDKKIWIEV